MVAVSNFGPAAFWPEPSFNEFIKLPALVRNGLAWGTKQQLAGVACEVRDVSQWIIDHYSVNQALPIGQLLCELENFVQDKTCCRMVRCYVDNHCNMVAAKLAWHEDY